MNTERREAWLWAAVWPGAALAAGLALRLWFIRLLPTVQGDSLVYGALAKNWLQHGVYGFGHMDVSPGVTAVRPTLIRLPGYPLFLAACFRAFGMENYRGAMYVQAVADLLTCWLASSLARRLFGRRAALAVLWLACLCPFTANYVAAPLTETLVLTTIALALYGFTRWLDAGLGYNRWLWMVCAALGYSILLRPDQGLLAAAIVPAMLWRALAARRGKGSAMRAASPVLAMALCAALPLVPWTLRNWRTFHVFQPLAPRYANDPGEAPPRGFARWYRTWAIDFASTDEVYWNYNGDEIPLGDLPTRAFDVGSPQADAALRARTAALLDDYNAVTTNTPQIDARFAALGAERARAHPVLYYAGLPVARTADMMLRPRVEMMNIPDEWWSDSAHPARRVFAAAYAALNLAYLAVACAGFFAWRRGGWVSFDGRRCGELAFAMTAFVLLRTALLLTLDNAEPRYTLEFFPLILIFAGALFAQRREATTGR
jgi:4-amino-4-deoxy-L-arabinose transferase-like glycosyltransferase